jgi:hypothetical protein
MENNQGRESPAFSLEEEVNLSLSPTPSENVIGLDRNENTLTNREKELLKILGNRRTMLMKANSFEESAMTPRTFEREIAKIGENVRNQDRHKGGKRKRKTRKHLKKRNRRGHGGSARAKR